MKKKKKNGILDDNWSKQSNDTLWWVISQAAYDLTWQTDAKYSYTGHSILKAVEILRERLKQ